MKLHFTIHFYSQNIKIETKFVFFFLCTMIEVVILKFSIFIFVEQVAAQKEQLSFFFQIFLGAFSKSSIQGFKMPTTSSHDVNCKSICPEV